MVGSNIALLVTLGFHIVHSFQSIPPIVSQQTGTRTNLFADRKEWATAEDKNDLHFDRRQMLAVVGAWSLMVQSTWAANEEVVMPRPEEQIKQDEAAAAMEERLRRKAELQKKMSSPKNFNESLKNEFSKQGDINRKTKEERRNAMCEELGRGC